MEEQMLSKKERNQNRREEKKKEQNKLAQNRNTKKYLKWIVYVLIIAVVIYLFSLLAGDSNEPRPGVQIPVGSRTHIQLGEAHEEYISNPPTSGSHANPLNWGVYSSEIRDENAIHNLEHGGIWISYKDLDEESILRLESIGDEFPRSVIVSPRQANDNSIVLASWGRLLEMDTINEDLIREYIDKNTNRSPERLAF